MVSVKAAGKTLWAALAIFNFCAILSSRLQDGIKVEFEEQLPMKDYAIRVPTWLAHKLPEILDLYITSGRVEKMQKVLDCAWRLHW